jgi:hypothetical protein
LLLAILLVLAGTTATGCGGGPEALDRRTFERGLIEQERITAEQARCVSQGIFEFYRPDEIRRIHDDGFSALPQLRWSGYQRVMGRCLFRDELARLPPPTPPELPPVEVGR